MRNRQPPPPLNPPSKPPSVESLVADVASDAEVALGAARIATKAATRVVDALPKPDPHDDPNFQRLAGAAPRDSSDSSRSRCSGTPPPGSSRLDELEGEDTRERRRRYMPLDDSESAGVMP